MKQKTYLDYNATAPIRAETIEIMTQCMASPHNASSIHSFGREGRKYVEKARDTLSKATNCPAPQIIFNAGATEGNNTILNHFKDERILTSAIEHPSVLEALPNSQTIPVTHDGIVDLNALEALLKESKTALVSVMLINNETGAIQPIKAISDIAHSNGALMHCDGVQALGRIEIDMQALGIDFLTLSAHKVGGPHGVGALCLRLCGETPILLHGGGQEKSARAGTENVAGIAGFGKAIELAIENLTTYQENTLTLRTSLETALSKMDGIKIHSQNTQRATNTTLFSIPSMPSETLLMALDIEGIAVSNGSACSSGKVEPSHVLTAMGADKDQASSAIRISTGWNSTQDDVDAFITAFTKVYTRIAP